MQDDKLAPRVHDPILLANLHMEWRECALAEDAVHGGDFEFALSLHHVSKHPRDDLRANLVMLCGSGTTGCHGRVEARDPETLLALTRYIRRQRPDTVKYLEGKSRAHVLDEPARRSPWRLWLLE